MNIDLTRDEAEAISHLVGEAGQKMEDEKWKRFCLLLSTEITEAIEKSIEAEE